MHQELIFFCRAFLAGACLAAGYDILRIFRNLVVHGAFWVGMEDLIYWCLAGLFLFSVIYVENDGVIRIYALFAVGLGALIYHVGPGAFLVKYLTWFLRKVGDLLRILARPVIKQRKRLKFWQDRVKLSLSEQKSIRNSRKRENEKKEKEEKKSTEQDGNA